MGVWFATALNNGVGSMSANLSVLVLALTSEVRYWKLGYETYRRICSPLLDKNGNSVLELVIPSRTLQYRQSRTCVVCVRQ
jgi:hypothetical protein